MDRSKLNRSFAAGVSLYRKMRSLSADECAKELGISKSTLLNIEQNQANPTLDTVSLMADNMGLDPRLLLFNSGGSDLAAAMLLMELLGPQSRFDLDTLQQALAHVQAALDLLTQPPTKKDNK